jgi:hypothetical protein
MLSHDVLLHLVKFVNPIDSVNLLLSGILKGFENVNKGIDLQKRYKLVFFDPVRVVFDLTYLFRIRNCSIKFGSGICNLDIR